MSNVLFVSHSIYLSPEERKMLGSGPAIVEAKGISAAVTDKGDHVELTEVICHYHVSNIDKQEAAVEVSPDGFKVYTGDFSKCSGLLDTPEGAAWLSLRATNTLKFKGTEYLAYHQIVFKDSSSLEDSAVLDSLSTALQQKK